VLYTHVDGQCNKLVTTLTVHRSCQHQRRSAVSEICLMTTKI